MGKNEKAMMKKDTPRETILVGKFAGTAVFWQCHRHRCRHHHCRCRGRYRLRHRRC